MHVLLHALESLHAMHAEHVSEHAHAPSMHAGAHRSDIQADMQAYMQACAAAACQQNSVHAACCMWHGCWQFMFARTTASRYQQLRLFYGAVQHAVLRLVRSRALRAQPSRPQGPQGARPYTSSSARSRALTASVLMQNIPTTRRYAAYDIRPGSGLGRIAAGLSG